MKLSSLCDRWFLLIVMILHCFSMQATIIDKKMGKAPIVVDTVISSAGLYYSVADTATWHPEEFLIVWIFMKLKFKLPFEKDQSGVFNLLFQCKETGEIHLIDTIKDNSRYFNFRLTSGRYDAILLYNNGKYIRYSDVAFEKNATTEVDMGKLEIQPSDSASLQWLALRTFNTAIGDRMICKNYSTVSEKKIRGYIFCDNIGSAVEGVQIFSTDEIPKISGSTEDGYFELDVDDDTNKTLKIYWIGYFAQEVSLKSNSGLILLMDEGTERPGSEDIGNLKNSPLIKIR